MNCPKCNSPKLENEHPVVDVVFTCYSFLDKNRNNELHQSNECKAIVKFVTEKALGKTEILQLSLQKSNDVPTAIENSKLIYKYLNHD